MKNQPIPIIEEKPVHMIGLIGKPMPPVLLHVNLHNIQAETSLDSLKITLQFLDNLVAAQIEEKKQALLKEKNEIEEQCFSKNLPTSKVVHKPL